MNNTEKRLAWCLEKAQKELALGKKHRGLIKITPDKQKALEHIKKAEHNLKAAIHFAKTEYSDWSASAFFYSIYQSLLAIAIKFGYDSRNQECTFALINSLIENKQIPLNKELIEKVALLDSTKDELTTMQIREHYQYGTKLSIEENLEEELLEITKEILSKAKVIIEQ
ncbi:MAG: HEPN domain-containing protein [Nanoarchaeota archaeon]